MNYRIRETEKLAKWFLKLKDNVAKGQIISRLSRFRNGNFGDVKAVDGKVLEARLHFGAGYRIYFAIRGNELIVLLCGGDKSTQQRDIMEAGLELEKIDNDHS